MKMPSKTIIRVCGATALVLLLVFAALGPAKLQVRSGLGWQFDHVAGYFAFTLMFCIAWPRPLAVGGSLIASGILLEALQALTPDRHANLEAALLSAGGALAGAVMVDLFIRSAILLKGCPPARREPVRLASWISLASRNVQHIGLLPGSISRALLMPRVSSEVCAPVIVRVVPPVS
jgi:VanZ family protein